MSETSTIIFLRRFHILSFFFWKKFFKILATEISKFVGNDCVSAERGLGVLYFTITVLEAWRVARASPLSDGRTLQGV
jgi:hypothetical protein